STFPIELDLSLDGRVIAFATILSLATTLVCGLVPAWRGSQTSGVAGFKGEIGGTIRRRRPFGLVAQVVLSFVLLLIAGSVIETLSRLQATDPGFAVNGRLYAYIYFPSASTPETGRQLYVQALDRLRALPGVLSASQTDALPLMPSGTDCVSLPGGPPLPRFYRPFARQYSGELSAVLLETGTDPVTMLPAVRETLLAMGQQIRVYAVQPLSTYIDQSFTGVRWMATALSGFGLLALVLAAIGLYGVIGYRVSLRTQEIGVRMALGAGRGAIFRDVVLHGLTIALVGVLAGEVLAIPASRALASVQAGIRPAAPSMHAAAAVIWVAVAFVACYVPASRASRVDP